MSWYTHTISELLKMNVGALNLSSCSEKINFTVLFFFSFYGAGQRIGQVLKMKMCWKVASI